MQPDIGHFFKPTPAMMPSSGETTQQTQPSAKINAWLLSLMLCHLFFEQFNRHALKYCPTIKNCRFLVTKDFYSKHKVIYTTNDTLISINAKMQQEILSTD